MTPSYHPIHLLLGITAPLMVPFALVIALLCRLGFRVEGLILWAVGVEVRA